jgi:hypothetical protein
MYVSQADPIAVKCSHVAGALFAFDDHSCLIFLFTPNDLSDHQNDEYTVHIASICPQWTIITKRMKKVPMAHTHGYYTHAYSDWYIQQIWRLLAQYMLMHDFYLNGLVPDSRLLVHSAQVWSKRRPPFTLNTHKGAFI